MGSLTRFNLPHIKNVMGLDTLVETGTGLGDSLAWAVRAGFSQLHSVEQVPKLFETCRQRFVEQPSVHLRQGDSLTFLREISAMELHHALFFLDAHFAGGADFGLTTYAESAAKDESYPLLDELKALLECNLSSSLIVIDDVRMYFEGAFQTGECPEFARRWSEKDSLLALLKHLDSTHTAHLLREDDGYLVVVPKTVSFERARWLNIRPHDSSGAVTFFPDVPGATCISIQRRLADSRFATRYFRGLGIDVGGGRDSLAAYKELFPLIGNVFVYDRPYGDAQELDNVFDNSFDFLYSSHCLEHMKIPARALANWIRVVKQGGYLVISVPDEDLYEQGQWPSRFNSDHKHSFTMAKPASWSPVSINVLDLLGDIRDQVEIIAVDKIDQGYRYESLPRHVDQTRTPLAESALEFILRKRGAPDATNRYPANRPVTPEQTYANLGGIRNARVRCALPDDFPHTVVIPQASYSPWAIDKQFMAAHQAIRSHTLVDEYRCYELWQLVRQTGHIKGDILEVGVWRGGTGCLMALARKQTCGSQSHIYLADTFSGVVKAGDQDPRYRGGEHADTSAKQVEDLLTANDVHAGTTILAGVFPDDTAATISQNRFRLCHIDVDTYQSARDVFDWAWPRMSIGGVIVFDDYGFNGCEGVTRAVNEIVAQALGLLIYNLNGHGLIVKAGKNS